MPVETKQRRTQAERSAKTQRIILDAALSVFADVGLANASTQQILERGKVSRGAMLHHYPSKALLIEAAFKLLLEEEVKLLVVFSATLKEQGRGIASLARYIWDRYKGRVFLVSVDYLCSARVDAKTRSSVAETSQKFNDALDLVWDGELEELGLPTHDRRAIMNEGMCLIRGMAFQRLWRDDDAYFDEMLENWIDRIKTLNKR